jgi:hypothetical protein
MVAVCSILAIAHAGADVFEGVGQAIAIPSPTSVTAGDFDRDGKVDLAVTLGRNEIALFYQDPGDPSTWTKSFLEVGNGSFFVRAADLDGDGNCDLAVADPGSTLYLIASAGNRTFQAPISMAKVIGPRWIAAGDWNGDGLVDLATADHDRSTVSILLNEGGVRHDCTAVHFSILPHSIETIDDDGDGKSDLLFGGAERGAMLLRGNGTGTFLPLSTIESSAHQLSVGDLDGDGKDDFACDDTIALSLGNGTFQKVGSFPFTAAVLLADLDRDRKDEIFLAKQNAIEVCRVEAGKMLPAELTVSAGIEPISLLFAADFNGDGLQDLASLDSNGTILFWGTGDRRMLEASASFTMPSTAKSLAIADLDIDGMPDILIPDAREPRVFVYLSPGTSRLPASALTIETQRVYSRLEAIDLDSDGIPDLIGVDPAAGLVQVALLSPDGKVRSEVTLPTDRMPSLAAAGRIDGDPAIDLAVPCTGSQTLVLFQNRGEGRFSAEATVPTVRLPKKAFLADLDSDGLTDMVVAGLGEIAAHFGFEGFRFSDPATVLGQPSLAVSDLVVRDIDGNGIPDIIATDAKGLAAIIIPGLGSRRFGSPRALATEAIPVSLHIEDLDADGLPDLTTAIAPLTSLPMIAVFRNRGAGEFDPPSSFAIPFIPIGHRLADLDKDGRLDLVAFSSSKIFILPGRREGAAKVFRRGDANGDRQLDLADPIRILERLFLGGEPLPCEDAADANDDGSLDLADPVTILGHLFLGGPPLPPPGEACGDDATPDGLGCGKGC